MRATTRLVANRLARCLEGGYGLRWRMWCLRRRVDLIAMSNAIIPKGVFVTTGSCVPEIPDNEVLWNVPNAITGGRIVVTTVLFLVAIKQNSAILMWVGLIVYWVFDTLDGVSARLLHQETRAGALLDSQADRLAIILFLVAFIQHYPLMEIPSLLYIAELLMIQSMLYDQYLRFRIPSPNYFYKVHRPIWILNWSAPAKIFSTGIITASIAFLQSPEISLVLIAVSLTMRAPGLYRVLRMSDKSHDVEK